ncbi:PD-(D/E)XK nuclease family protein [Ruegeria denitrificans]|uniref:PD-(D/E)XK nuclease family protein n=1 Tax=Ruegeria denitrificans TaxID=1715692 RepID=UPI0013F4CBFD|nr:PD-(D/E)XK nuclease family protein [Ruegeria denitrificans]
MANQLIAHHGAAPDAEMSAFEQGLVSATAPVSGALGFVQSNLGKSGEGTSADETLRVFGVRDPQEEADFAAARAQQLLQDGIVDLPADIGVLVPDDRNYERALAEAFDRVGIPLSGQAEAAIKRDLTAELLLLLLTLLEAPASRTALASLYTSPLMPWPGDTGRRMARELMDRGWSETAKELEGAGRLVLDALRETETLPQLSARLMTVTETLPDVPLTERIGQLGIASAKSLDWSVLRKRAEPRKEDAPDISRFVEGVSLFTENALPWRPARHLIVLGLTGKHWPRLPASNPVFTESEIRLIRETTGLILPGRREHLSRGLEMFRRQLCSATEGATLLVPALDLAGKSLSPSTGFALISHLLGASDPADLLCDVRGSDVTSIPVPTEALPTQADPAASLPEDGIISLNTDLLRLRQASEGGYVRQSPSRLETLLVSPLAWLMDELGAKDRTWASETLDVMTLGTIMHHILEVVFPKEEPIPDATAVDVKTPEALVDAIKCHAIWLNGPAWNTERANLLREARMIAQSWGGFLRKSEATVLHNEIGLEGDFDGLPIAGRADSLLRLPNDRVLVVDHKRSKSYSRRARMTKGWDLQVALYRAMLERPSEAMSLTRLVPEGVKTTTAYHTMLDATVLTDFGGEGIPGAEVASVDISANATDHLLQAVSEARAGIIRLNRSDDISIMEKDRGITPYALKDNEFVKAFTLPAEEGSQ